MRDPRIERLAEVLIHYSLNVQRDEVVVVRAPAVASPLITELVRSILRVGAHPVLRVRIPETEELLCKLGEPHQLTYIYPGNILDVEAADCMITVHAEENTKFMANVNPANQEIIGKARQPLLEVMLRRETGGTERVLRRVAAQFPCNSAAQEAVMSLEEYEDFVFKAGLLHLADPAKTWQKIGLAQQHACEFLQSAKELRFIGAGTDLRMGIEGRQWINCDGKNQFPDGEIFTGPIETATTGYVHFTLPTYHAGQEVSDVRLRFDEGRVIDASAVKGEALLHEMLDRDEGARVLGEIAIGTNYSIKQFTNNSLFDDKIGGTFHATLGAGHPLTGSKNTSVLRWDMVCDLRKGGRIEVDGKEVSKSGRFHDAKWPKPIGRSRR